MTKHPSRLALAAIPTIAVRRKAGKETSMKTRLLIALSVMVAVSVAVLLGLSPSQAIQQTFTLKPTIAFTSTRDNPGGVGSGTAGEIYEMNPDGTNQRRLTNNGFGDGFPTLSPDGKKIVFDSNRLRGAWPLNTSDLFVMNVDDYDPVLPAAPPSVVIGGIPDDKQVHLTRGGSPIWSPNGKQVAFHASASGMGTPITDDPGAATTDSDIHVMNVDDCLELFSLTNKKPNESDCRKITVGDCNMLTDPTKAARCGTIVPELSKNITKSAAFIDDDPDWSPDGKKIVFTRHDPNDPLNVTPPYPNVVPSTEIYVINADGTGLVRLTFNAEEERAADWSKDGTRIAFMCRKGPLGTPLGSNFEICVMNADGTGQVQLTVNDVFEASPVWSPDSQQIVFQRRVPMRQNQLFRMKADGTLLAQLTNSAGTNLFPNWGVLRVPSQ